MAIKDGDKKPQISSDTLIKYEAAGNDGMCIGATVAEKVAFHGASPVVQRSSASQAAVATTSATNTSPYGFTTAAQANAIVTLLNEIRAALVEKGIIKGS